MPVHQGWQCKRDKDNNASATTQTRQLDRGSNAGATTVMTFMRCEGEEVSTIRTMTPAQQGQQHLCNVGNGAGIIRVTTPQWWWQRCLHIDNGNNAIATRATTSAWQGQLLSLRQGQQRYCGNSKDAWTAKMPAHWQLQHHCNKGNNTSSTTAKMPAHWWQQQTHCYKGNNTSLMTMQAWLLQRRHPDKGNNHHHNDSKDACASMATTLLWQGQQCHCNVGKYTSTLMMMTISLQQGQKRQLEDSYDAIATRATTTLLIKGNNAINTRTMMPSWQWQERLRIDNSNNAIVMSATIAIATMAKTLCIDGNNAIATWMTTPAQQQAIRATTLPQQWQRHACALTMARMPLWQEH
jgi:hypothetical protein